MFQSIDHFVVVVSDLESAIASYTLAGFTVVRGGKHNIGTHNALIAFAAYRSSSRTTLRATNASRATARIPTALPASALSRSPSLILVKRVATTRACSAGPACPCIVPSWRRLASASRLE